MRGGFAPESHFRSVDAVDARVATGCGESDLNPMAWEEAKNHKMTGFFLGEIDGFEYRFRAGGQLRKFYERRHREARRGSDSYGINRFPGMFSGGVETGRIGEIQVRQKQFQVDKGLFRSRFSVAPQIGNGGGLITMKRLEIWGG